MLASTTSGHAAEAAAAAEAAMAAKADDADERMSVRRTLDGALAVFLRLFFSSFDKLELFRPAFLFWPFLLFWNAIRDQQCMYMYKRLIRRVFERKKKSDVRHGDAGAQTNKKQEKLAMPARPSDHLSTKAMTLETFFLFDFT